MTAVALVPAGQRPYVDGSQHNSIYEQVFVYNGFGRLGDQTPLQLLAGQSLGIDLDFASPAPAPDRLLHGDLGHDTAWLLPAALVVAVVGVAARRGQSRRDPLRAALVLWGGWLVILGVTFSVITDINAYYTAALAPAVAAVLGVGTAVAWSGRRSGLGRRITLGVVVAGTVAYAGWLVAGAGPHGPGGLVPALIAVGLVATAAALVSVVRRGDGPFAFALAAGLIAASLAPAVASAQLVAHHEGAFDTPFESAAEKSAIDNVFVATPAQVRLTLPGLESARRGAPYLLATQTAALASVFIYDSGLEVLPIGGFTGTIPSPTLAQLVADVRAGRFHLALVATSTDPRVRWITSHCLDLGPATPALHNYYCVRSSAG